MRNGIGNRNKFVTGSDTVEERQIIKFNIEKNELLKLKNYLRAKTKIGSEFKK